MPHLSGSTFGFILEAILEVEEKVFIRHVSDLKYKGNKLVDVITKAAHLLKSTKAAMTSFGVLV